jgi:hypothetical protein
MWWIALLGAAVSAGVAAWRARGSDDRQRAIMLSCWRAGLRFSVLNPFPDIMWLPFPVFAPARSPRVTNVVWDRRDEAQCAFDVTIRPIGSEQGTGLELTDTIAMSCATATLPFSCPRLAVIDRGTTDPSGIELVGDEIALELEPFNRRYRVVATDPRAAVALLDQRMMRALMALPLAASVHVNERSLLLVAPRVRSTEMLLMLQTVRVLARTVPSVTASLYPPRPEVGPHEARWRQGRWSPEPTGS